MRAWNSKGWQCLCEKRENNEHAAGHDGRTTWKISSTTTATTTTMTITTTHAQGVDHTSIIHHHHYHHHHSCPLGNARSSSIFSPPITAIHSISGLPPNFRLPGLLTQVTEPTHSQDARLRRLLLGCQNLPWKGCALDLSGQQNNRC